MSKTAFLLAVVAITISVGMFAFVYMELQEIKQVQRISYEHAKEAIEHWEEYSMWELTDGRDASDLSYYNKWKDYVEGGLVIDDKYFNRMYQHMERDRTFPWD